MRCRSWGRCARISAQCEDADGTGGRAELGGDGFTDGPVGRADGVGFDGSRVDGGTVLVGVGRGVARGVASPVGVAGGADLAGAIGGATGAELRSGHSSHPASTASVTAAAAASGPHLTGNAHAGRAAPRQRSISAASGSMSSAARR